MASQVTQQQPPSPKNQATAVPKEEEENKEEVELGEDWEAKIVELIEGKARRLLIYIYPKKRRSKGALIAVGKGRTRKKRREEKRRKKKERGGAPLPKQHLRRPPRSPAWSSECPRRHHAKDHHRRSQPSPKNHLEAIHRALYCSSMWPSCRLRSGQPRPSPTTPPPPLYSPHIQEQDPAKTHCWRGPPSPEKLLKSTCRSCGRQAGLQLPRLRPASLGRLLPSRRIQQVLFTDRNKP